MGSRDVTATIAVSDIDRARHFYQDALGLKRIPSEEPDALLFRSGNSTILVYESRYAGSNQATALTWVVGDDLEKEAAALKAKESCLVHGRGRQHHRDGQPVSSAARAEWREWIGLAVIALPCLREGSHAEPERQAEPVALPAR